MVVLFAICWSGFYWPLFGGSHQTSGTLFCKQDLQRLGCRSCDIEYLLSGLCCTPQPCSDPEAKGWMLATGLQCQDTFSFREENHKILIFFSKSFNWTWILLKWHFSKEEDKQRALLRGSVIKLGILKGSLCWSFELHLVPGVPSFLGLVLTRRCSNSCYLRGSVQG